MPEPGEKSCIARTMFANSSWPADSSAATTSAWLMPSNCAPNVVDNTPSNTTFVASPSTFGPATMSTTPIAPSTEAKMNAHLWGFSSPRKRRKLGQKSFGFPPIAPGSSAPAAIIAS